MSKKLKRMMKNLLLLIIICSICIYEVHISYNKSATNNYSIATNQINNSVNIVIISDLHDNQLGKNNKDLIHQINVSVKEVLSKVIGKNFFYTYNYTRKNTSKE